MNLQETIAREEKSDLVSILSNQSGRRLMWKLLCHCGVYQDIRSDDPREDSRSLGRRSVGLWLMQIIGDCDQEKLFLMMKEAKLRADDHAHMAEMELEPVDESDKINVEFNIDTFLS